MEILTTVFVWLVTLAESIIVVVLSFVLLIVLIVGLSLESIFHEGHEEISPTVDAELCESCWDKFH